MSFSRHALIFVSSAVAGLAPAAITAPSAAASAGSGDTPPACLAVAATIGTGISPTGVAVNAKTGMVYVANQTFASNSVSVIDGHTNTVAATVPVGNNPLF